MVELSEHFGAGIGKTHITEYISRLAPQTPEQLIGKTVLQEIMDEWQDACRLGDLDQADELYQSLLAFNPYSEV